MIVGVLQTTISTSCYVDDDYIDVCDDFNGVSECDNYRCKYMPHQCQTQKGFYKEELRKIIRRFRCIHTHKNIYIHQPFGEIT